MVGFLIIALAACYYTRHVVNSHINFCKDDATSKDYGSRLANDTSKDYGSILADGIPLVSAVKDRISELPDDILSHILMPLSLRDVVRLTTLSRRWRKIWLVLPHLDLDWRALRGDPKCMKTKAGCDLYLKSVNQVLQCYKDQNILSFGISCYLGLEYASHVHRWLNFAATIKGLESFKLKFDLGYHHKISQVDEFPISGSFLSQFPRLTKLHLDTCALKLQSDFRFNKLKNLSLSYVYLEGIQWESLVCCPTIESLCLRGCYLPNKLRLGDNMEHLSLLTICRCPTLRRIELNASNLKIFEFDGNVDLECCFLARAKLKNLSVYFGGKAKGIENILRGLVNDLSGLKNLILRVEIHKLKLPTWAAGLFWSVSWLQLDLFLDVRPEGDITQTLPLLLRSFPRLRKLNLTCPSYDWPNYHRVRKCKLPTPYLHTNLVEVELYNFKESWTIFASFLLRSANVLNRMVITKNFKYYYGCGDWEDFPHSFSTAEYLCIQSALSGEALSPRANVIIQ